MADLREDFVNYVVKALVSNPDGVVLNRANDEKGDFLELTVDPADMGKVIGKAGATAKSIRTLLRVVGAKDDLPPLPLKIVEPEGAEAPYEAAQPDDSGVQEEAVVEAQEEPEQPAEQTEAEEAPKDDHADKHAKTRKEMEELADLEL
jgi:uncharacterized protein